MSAPSPYHIMIDFETLDSIGTAAVLSLGAVMFTKDKIVSEHYAEFALSPQLREGRTVSAPTLGWWFRQSASAQGVFADNGRVRTVLNKETIEEFFNTLAKNYLDNEPANNKFYNVRLWSNGAAFDIPILEHMFDMYGCHRLFYYGNFMCFRTFNHLTNCKELVTRAGTHHNALDDSIFQAQAVIAWFQKKQKAKK